MVDASHDESGNLGREDSGSGGVLRCPPGTLTPDLWAAGIARSTGRVVPDKRALHGRGDVAGELMSALQEGEMGAAGRVDLAE